MLNRFTSIVNLEQYARNTAPLSVGDVTIFPPKEEQYVLRMLIQAPYSNGLKLPEQLAWLESAIQMANKYQTNTIGVKHPFTYVTVRHGIVKSKTDDAWHVDGFSTRYTHLPESNYIFSFGPYPTQYLDQQFIFPDDFDPLVYNVHEYFQDHAKEKNIVDMESGMMYFVDPYVIHRRNPESTGCHRTFVRISFTPIEIPDINNTKNPLIPTPHYVLDGVRDFRDSLRRYPSKVT